MTLFRDNLRPYDQILTWVTFLILTSIFILTDSLYSTFHNHQFNFIESSIRSTFWCLFIPVLHFYDTYSFKNNLFKYLIIPLSHTYLFLFFIFYIYSVNISSLQKASNYGLLIILIYGSYFILEIIYKKSSSPTVKEEISSKTDSDNIIIKKGTKRIVVYICNIVYIKTSKPYIEIVTPDNKYLHNSTLSKFLLEFGSEQFLRVHRSAIVNESMVQSIISRKNGDFDLIMRNGDVVRASRNFRDRYDHLI